MDITLRNMTSIYLYHDNKFLLLYRIGSKIVKNCYIGSAGGHFENFELNDPKACILRELFEETGLSENDIDDLNLRYVTLRLKNGEIRHNYYYFAHLKTFTDSIRSNEGILSWWNFEEVETLDMPFTAKHVVSHWLQTGRFTDILYSGIATETGCEFRGLKEF